MSTAKAFWADIDEPAPRPWRHAALVAAAVVFLSVATSRWVPVGAEQVARLLGGYRMLSSALLLVAPLVWISLAGLAVGVVVLGLRHPWWALVASLTPLLAVVPGGSNMPFAAVVLPAGVVVAAAWRSPASSVAATCVALSAVGAWIHTGVPMSAPLGAYVELRYTQPLAVGLVYAVALVALLAVTLLARAQVATSLERDRLAARSATVEEQSVVTGERARLARDLHDVVAHHVSLIAVRAETAPYTHPGLGTDARSILSEIAVDARRALDELRGVLGILGRSTEEGRAPQPAWGDIATLVERARSGGDRVELSGDADADVPAAPGYVAYRVVQEALTNARRHAPGSRVQVVLQRLPRLAVVEVHSAGVQGRGMQAAVSEGPEPTMPLAGPGAGSGAGFGSQAAPGRGLAGMRERVESLGGRLTAGRRDGGFVVEATLPLWPETPA